MIDQKALRHFMGGAAAGGGGDVHQATLAHFVGGDGAGMTGKSGCRGDCGGSRGAMATRPSPTAPTPTLGNGHIALIAGIREGLPPGLDGGAMAPFEAETLIHPVTVWSLFCTALAEELALTVATGAAVGEICPLLSGSQRQQCNDIVRDLAIVAAGLVDELDELGCDLGLLP